MWKPGRPMVRQLFLQPKLQNRKTNFVLFITGLTACLCFCVHAQPCLAEYVPGKTLAMENSNLGDAPQECSWENFQRERRNSKLRLDSKIYVGVKNEKEYEETYFDRRMYLYCAYSQSNKEGPDSAVVILSLLHYACELDKGRDPEFTDVVTDINSRVQTLSTEEQNKVLHCIAGFPTYILHSDREIAAIPLIYTTLGLCEKPGISVDKKLAQRLLWIQKHFYGDWEQVKPNPARDKCAIAATKKSIELFEKLDSRSKEVVVAHEHLARLYEIIGQKDDEAKQFLEVLQFNAEKQKGDWPPFHVLKSLMELYLQQDRIPELVSAFKKYSTFVSTSVEALEIARLVSDLVKMDSFDSATAIAINIFPKMNFEEPSKPKPPAKTDANVFQMIGCQLTPRCYSQPSWYLSGWLNKMCEAGAKKQAQYLYSECISAALKAGKGGTREFQLSADCASRYSLKKAL